MQITNMSYAGPREIRYLFIDGAYFRKVVQKLGEEFFGTATPPIDYQKVGSGYTKVFYYDCLSPRGTNESNKDYESRVEQQRADFANLSLLDGWHVSLGKTVGTGKQARQKQVDIQIAVDMLMHSHRRNMHRIAFITGDQDFKPLVDAVVREGMFIELWYEPRSASQDLVDAADSRRKLDAFAIHGLLTQAAQKQHCMPIRTSQPKDGFDNELALDVGRGQEGQVELYRDERGYVILHPDKNNDGYFLHLWHDDLAYLTKLYEHSYGHVLWEKKIVLK